MPALDFYVFTISFLLLRFFVSYFCVTRPADTIVCRVFILYRDSVIYAAFSAAGQNNYHESNSTPY
jgi:hypothetical protein